MEPTVGAFSMSLVLADYAQAVQGKLYVTGAGWNLKAEAPAPMAIAAIVGVPWGETNSKHKAEFELVDANGKPFQVQTPTGSQALNVAAEFEVGRPVGVPQGITFNVPIAINLIPLPIPVGDYVWIGKINGQGRNEWRLPFTVLPELPAQPA